MKKSVGVMGEGETPCLTQIAGETHRVLELTQIHPPGNQHLKGHNQLVGSKGSDGKWGESQASGIIPSLIPLPHTVTLHNEVLAPPWRIPKALPLTT